MPEMHLSLLSSETELAYDQFLQNHEGALFYHSLKYRDFLKTVLDTSQDIYILAHEGNKLIGVLPAFIKRLNDGASVINSLPFFGSHGGFLISSDALNPKLVKEMLMNRLSEIGKQENALSLTVIDNPQGSGSDFYKSYFQIEASDQRISQITDISVSLERNISEELMKKFHYKTRNMVRKGLKSGFSVTRDESLSGLKLLYQLHSENMKAINGKEKPFFIFEAIHKIFEINKDYRLYIAEKKGEIAAALLLFYYKDYCEYFTPAINQKFRSEQPLSMLIFYAMQEASLRGCHYWNWGGTWLSQDGVYLFKKRWGAEENLYGYYCMAFQQLRHSLTPQFYYVYPKKNI